MTHLKKYLCIKYTSGYCKVANHISLLLLLYHHHPALYFVGKEYGIMET